MNKLAIATAIAATITGAAYAQESKTTGVTSPIQTQVLIAIPQNVTTVTNFYKQNVYDPSDVKIGEINDVLVDNDGKIGAFIIGVGGSSESVKRTWPCPSIPSVLPKGTASGG
jgi:hypothetical protein